MDFDVAVFYWIKDHLQSPMLSAFMGFITEKKHFVFPGALASLILLLVFRKRGIAFLITVGLMVALTDALLHYLLKPWVGRPRPCHTVDILQHVINCSNSFSFPSNHAGNSFTVATLAVLCFRNTVLLMLTLALTIAFSRVYLGLHYPTDIVGGAICGIVMGYLGYRLNNAILDLLVDPPAQLNEPDKPKISYP